MQLELRQLRYFVTVAETLNFTRAAEQLLISQPALSQQIVRAEQQLGVQLLERDRRQVRLTPAGDELLIRARRLLQDHEELIRAVRRVAGVQDTLRVGYVESSNLPFIAPAVRAVQQAFPQVRVERLEVYSALQAQAVLERRIDVGIGGLPVEQAGLDSLLLMNTRWSVALPAAHALARLDAVPVAALRDVPLIVAPAHINPPLYQWLLGQCRRQGFEARIVFESTSMAGAMQLALEQVGFPVVCSSSALGRWPEMVVRPLADPEAATQVGAIWRSDGRSPLVRTFVRAAAKLQGVSPRAAAQLA
ncbi:LysR family transcriptional regulator [Deinococcus oregonensis]|uniref:LysR family transcriptional regulator n=1 Tax=Deinococcus oregonensis TaxID=1805970 RepID=A0ABV6AUG0_9DEIO